MGKSNILDIVFGEDRRPDGKRDERFVPNLARPREIGRDAIKMVGKTIKKYKENKGRVRK